MWIVYISLHKLISRLASEEVDILELQGVYHFLLLLLNTTYFFHQTLGQRCSLLWAPEVKS